MRSTPPRSERRRTHAVKSPGSPCPPGSVLLLLLSDYNGIQTIRRRALPRWFLLFRYQFASLPLYKRKDAAVMPLPAFSLCMALFITATAAPLARASCSWHRVAFARKTLLLRGLWNAFAFARCCFSAGHAAAAARCCQALSRARRYRPFTSRQAPRFCVAACHYHFFFCFSPTPSRLSPCRHAIIIQRHCPAPHHPTPPLRQPGHCQPCQPW